MKTLQLQNLLLRIVNKTNLKYLKIHLKQNIQYKSK